jgi:rhomboid protease GluP
MTPVESVLRLCESAEPNPWYPRPYFNTNQDARAALDPALDQLRLGGFIELTPWTAEHGQGYRLTDQGRMLLRNSRNIERLNRGDLPPPKPISREEPRERPANSQRWMDIRDALTADEPAMVTRILGGICIGVFVWGMLLASRAHVAAAFFAGSMGGDSREYTKILVQTGSVSVLDMLGGQWWRMLTANFVHAGVLHIGMNMFVLFMLGPMVERMYGHWRFLLLCLVSGVGSTAAAMYFQGGMMVGFSGVLCAMFGAILSWILINRSILRPEFVSGQMRWLVQNAILLVIVSLAPGVSWAGHLGGAVFGFLAGLLLTVSRFGPTGIRVPAVLGAMALGVFCVLGFKPVAKATGKWKAWAEDYGIVAFDDLGDGRAFAEIANAVEKTLFETDAAVRRSEEYMLLRDPNKPGGTQRTVDNLETQLNRLSEAAADVASLPRGHNERINEVEEVLAEQINARTALYERKRKALESPDPQSDQADIATLKKRCKDADQRWKDLCGKK